MITYIIFNNTYLLETKLLREPIILIANKNILLMLASLLFCAACASYTDSSDNHQVSLTSQPWLLMNIGDEKVSLGVNDKPLTLEFLKEAMNYRGFAGCNNYSGRYELTQTNLELGPAMATRKMCQLTSDLEHKYLQTLATVDNYELQGNILTLTDKANNVLLIFKGK